MIDLSCRGADDRIIPSSENHTINKEYVCQYAKNAADSQDWNGRRVVSSSQ